LIGLEGAGISTGRLSSWKGWRCEQNREADRHASSRCSVDLATHRSLPRRRLWIGRNRARGGTLPPSGSAVPSVCDRVAVARVQASSRPTSTFSKHAAGVRRLRKTPCFELAGTIGTTHRCRAAFSIVDHHHHRTEADYFGESKAHELSPVVANEARG